MARTTRKIVKRWRDQDLVGVTFTIYGPGDGSGEPVLVCDVTNGPRVWLPVYPHELEEAAKKLRALAL